MKAVLYQRTPEGLLVLAELPNAPDGAKLLGLPFQQLGPDMQPIGTRYILDFTLIGFDVVNDQALFIYTGQRPV